MTKPFRVASVLVPAVAVSLVALTAAPAAAQTVEDFLESADMTFTLEEADEMAVYEVTTKDGYTFTLFEAEDGYTFTLDESRPPTVPQSGDWSREFEVLRIDCSDHGPRGEAAIRSAVAGIEPILNNFLGSTDGGATAPYRFSPPFDAEQLLGSLFGVLEMAEISSRVTYGETGRNLYTAKGRLMQPSDFTVEFQMELGVVGPCLIMGEWFGAVADDPDCRAAGLVTWQKQRCL
ncbi:MAG: hypothetical protein R2991_10790 [Thermoanaerobaculia bacterium]